MITSTQSIIVFDHQQLEGLTNTSTHHLVTPHMYLKHTTRKFLSLLYNTLGILSFIGAPHYFPEGYTLQWQYKQGDKWTFL